MRTCITPKEFAPIVFMQEPPAKQNNSDSETIPNAETKIVELENELKKQKAAAEKNAKLIQKIWGDNFQSDSLH